MLKSFCASSFTTRHFGLKLKCKAHYDAWALNDYMCCAHVYDLYLVKLTDTWSSSHLAWQISQCIM